LLHEKVADYDMSDDSATSVATMTIVPTLSPAKVADHDEIARAPAVAMQVWHL
jgi:hypothetical protein